MSDYRREEMTDAEHDEYVARQSLPLPAPAAQAEAGAVVAGICSICGRPKDYYSANPNEGVCGCSKFAAAPTPLDRTTDAINHPPHYTATDIEPIDVIEAWELGFCAGNVVKYIARAKHKGNELEDLRKAAWYLNREIERVERI